jgi:hypothetical protein
MRVKKWGIALLGGSLLATSSAAAEDIPALPPITSSIGVEAAPEFRTQTGALVDGYVKANGSHTFDSGLIWGGSFQYTDRVDGNRQYQPETTVGYNLKLNGIWSIPLSAGIGYRWNENPNAMPSQQFAYYVFNAGLNMKISENWTWNMFSARYRDAFEGNWQTPKVTTGLTYAIDRQNSVYGNVGYAWRNGLPNKISVAFGYKYGF